MKASKKNEKLEKYLEKKKKQQTRDELLAQIKMLSNTSNKKPLVKNKKIVSKKIKKTIYEDKFLSESDEEIFEKNNKEIENNLQNNEEFGNNFKKTNKEIKNNLQNNEEFGDFEWGLERNKFKECNSEDINDINQIQEYIEIDDKNNNFEKLDKNDYFDKKEINKDITLEEKAVINDILPEITCEEINLDLNLPKTTFPLPLKSEIFVPVTNLNRLEEIQLQRQKLKIFYDQHEIIEHIKKSMITIIQGDTGCGKTTQIPQFLYEHGFSNNGIIGITQPRRISAISISSRINKEINDEIAGYKIKYENTITKNTKIKFLTEGVLLREIQSDFLLKSYSIIILDEIHERSANMDILIGLLSKAIILRYNSKNPLRLILMSATISLNNENFKNVLGEYSIFKLKSNQFKVSVFYESKTTENYLKESFEKIIAILESQNIKKKKHKKLEIPNEIQNDSNSAILVFLPGKDDIYKLQKMLEDFDKNSELKILPLHSGLTNEEQSKVYEKYENRKIVLATNIAETSITIDDIVFVIDTGRSKYRFDDSRCIKYQIGFISKSSARQRMGRAGRVRPGVCFRIFSGVTYDNMIENNIPQINIQSIDGNILFLKSIGIDKIYQFPFLSPPTEEAIKDATNYLINLGALSEESQITKLGNKISKYPVSPRLGRILCMKGIEDIFSELCLIVSMLSCGFELKKSSQIQHFFINAKSDFIAFLNIFKNYLNSPKKYVFCKKHALRFNSMIEIEKLWKYLIKISKKENNENISLDDEKNDKICKIIYQSYSDHVALNSGNNYIYDGGDVFISKDSISVSNEQIVFDHMLCGEKKVYLKFITIINPKWFE